MSASCLTITWTPFYNYEYSVQPSTMVIFTLASPSTLYWPLFINELSIGLSLRQELCLLEQLLLSHFHYCEIKQCLWTKFRKSWPFQVGQKEIYGTLDTLGSYITSVLWQFHLISKGLRSVVLLIFCQVFVVSIDSCSLNNHFENRAARSKRSQEDRKEVGAEISPISLVAAAQHTRW